MYFSKQMSVYNPHRHDGICHLGPFILISFVPLPQLIPESRIPNRPNTPKPHIATRDPRTTVLPPAENSCFDVFIQKDQHTKTYSAPKGLQWYSGELTFH
jgi:hypothetical protein